MHAIDKPDFRYNEYIQATEILKALIPTVWKQVFIAPMAIHGSYEQIGLRSRTLDGLFIKISKDYMEIDYKEETWKVSWAVGRPWHVTGDWIFSPNWRKSTAILPALIETLASHAIDTTKICHL